MALSENLGVIHQNCPGKEGKRDTPERERRERESRAKKSRAKKKHEREREREKQKRKEQATKREGAFFYFFVHFSLVFSLSLLLCFFYSPSIFFSLLKSLLLFTKHSNTVLFARLFLLSHLSLSKSLSQSLSVSRFRRSEQIAFGTFERQTERLNVFRASARDDDINDFLLETTTTTTTTTTTSSSSSNDNNNERFKEFVLSIHENRSRNDRARVTPAVRRDETRERNKRDTSRRGWWRERGDSVRVVPRWWFWRCRRDEERRRTSSTSRRRRR